METSNCLDAGNQVSPSIDEESVEQERFESERTWTTKDLESEICLGVKSGLEAGDSKKKTLDPPRRPVKSSGSSWQAAASIIPGKDDGNKPLRRGWKVVAGHLLLPPSTRESN